MSYFHWRPYVSVAQRRHSAQRHLQKLAKKGLTIQPVEITGRTIATSFWGAAWCEHMESFSDFANRLPRGRTYVRNGSVCHLDVQPGRIGARVSGSDLYEVSITVKPLPPTVWTALKQRCAGGIASLLDLLQGRLSAGVMQVVTDRQQGLFPLPGQMEFDCSCPDWADMCKHVAAVLYGVGARLDQQPELLFRLRQVNHEELLEAGTAAMVAGQLPLGQKGKGRRRRLATGAVAEVFGVDLEQPADAPAAAAPAATTIPSATPEPKTRPRARTRPPARAAARPLPPPPVFHGVDIRELRVRLGLSPAAFAQRLGVSTPSVKRWEALPGTVGLHRRPLVALQAAWRECPPPAPSR